MSDSIKPEFVLQPDTRCRVCDRALSAGTLCGECAKHQTEVKTVYPDHVHAAYQVVCEACGNVGLMQPYKWDAEAIAARHTLVGGFE